MSKKGEKGKYHPDQSKSKRISAQPLHGVEDGEVNYGFMCESVRSYVQFECCGGCHASGHGWYVTAEGVDFYVCCSAMTAMLVYEAQHARGARGGSDVQGTSARGILGFLNGRKR